MTMQRVLLSRLSLAATAVLLVLGGTVLPAQAQYSRPGSTDGEFLSISVSPRAAGMGDAFIAAVEGAEAAYYNPAGLPWIGMNATDVMLSHTRWFAGVNHEFAAVAHSFGYAGTVAASVTALYTDAMKVRTPLQPNGTGETFMTTNVRLGLSYARWVTDRVTFGGTVSLIHLGLYQDFAAKAFAVDIAAAYTADFRNFRFAMKIANLGSEVKYVSEAYPLPVNFTFGAKMTAAEWGDQRVTMSGTALKPNDGPPIGQVGMEYGFQQLLYLRGGYKINYDMASFSFGGGFRFDISDRYLRADYSFSDFGILGVAHRFGINLNI